RRGGALDRAAAAAARARGRPRARFAGVSFTRYWAPEAPSAPLLRAAGLDDRAQRALSLARPVGSIQFRLSQCPSYGLSYRGRWRWGHGSRGARMPRSAPREGAGRVPKNARAAPEHARAYDGACAVARSSAADAAAPSPAGAGVEAHALSPFPPWAMV